MEHALVWLWYWWLFRLIMGHPPTLLPHPLYDVIYWNPHSIQKYTTTLTLYSWLQKIWLQPVLLHIHFDKTDALLIVLSSVFTFWLLTSKEPSGWILLMSVMVKQRPCEVRLSVDWKRKLSHYQYYQDITILTIIHERNNRLDS